MTNGQDALVEVVLSKLDTMTIGEMSQTAKNLPKTSKLYTPLDNAIARYVSDHLSSMNFVEKYIFFNRIPEGMKAREILDKAMLEDAELLNVLDVMYFYNRVPDRSKTKTFLEDIVIDKQIPEMTFDEKGTVWVQNPTERIKNCLDKSMAKDISAELKEAFPAFFMKEVEPDETRPPQEELEELPPVDTKKVFNLWRKTLPKSKAKAIIEKAILKMSTKESHEFWDNLIEGEQSES